MKSDKYQQYVPDSTRFETEVTGRRIKRPCRFRALIWGIEVPEKYFEVNDVFFDSLE